MAPGSLVGFGGVLALGLWTFSAGATLAVRAARGRLRACGPLAERRAVELAAVVPIVLAVAVTAALLLRAAFGADHCQAHDHHPHLCLVHGGVWASRLGAVALLAGVGAAAATRLIIVVARAVRAHGHLATIRQAAQQNGEIYLAASPRAFCFVAGMRRPRVYASTAAWSALAPDEREAVLAHERAHIEHGDLGRRFGLELLLALGAPLAAGLLGPMWGRATERLCDARASAATGRPDAVANAMVRMCRLGASAPSAVPVGFTPKPAELSERVHAVLAGGLDGRRSARHLGLLAAWLCLHLIGAAALLAEPLHHALETLLG
jgi:Zn-dependent protease with chaperone function